MQHRDLTVMILIIQYSSLFHSGYSELWFGQQGLCYLIVQCWLLILIVYLLYYFRYVCIDKVFLMQFLMEM